MSTPTTTPTAGPRWEGLWDDLAARLGEVARRAVVRIERASPVYAELPPGVFVEALRGNLSRSVQIFRTLAEPTTEELEAFAATAVDRALQGFPLQDVLRAYRLGVAEIWTELSGLVVVHGLSTEDVVLLATTVRTWEDAVADAVAGAHARVGLQLAREEQQRRDAFVRALVAGTLQGEDLRRAAAGFGLDHEQPYLAVRIRPHEGAWPRGLASRVESGLGGRPGVVGHFEGDVVVVVPQAPEVLPGTTTAVGPPALLGGLPRSFAVATRALQTGWAFGLTGLVDLASLSIRPAVLADVELGSLFEERRLAALDGLGQTGVDIERTLRVWLEHGLRHEATAKALHLHPNTLRHRLRRYEEVTGSELRDITALVELWWALERRSLPGRASATGASDRISAE